MVDREAFVLRIAPSGVDLVSEALELNQIMIGWPDASDLTKPDLDWDRFREIIRRTFYAEEVNLRRAGAAAGHMWRFIREMDLGDLVVVPRGSVFYVAEVSGPAFYDPTKDMAYRRPVIWRNNKSGIQRALARSALVSRMKTYGTCADATDVLGQIEECLRIAESGQERSFEGDLQRRLVEATVEEMRSGRMDSVGFERLVKTVLKGLGAEEARIVPRNKDKGADIVATFLVAGAFRLVVAVQAKHWQPDPPVGSAVVEQLIKGIEAESANLGMVITSGTISDEAYVFAGKYAEDNGIKIELIDGDAFAKLIVERGSRIA